MRLQIAVPVLALLLMSSASAKPPAVVKKPPTAWKLGGYSLSTINDEQIAAALRMAVGSLGYTVGSVDDSTACVWEGRFASLTKNGGRFTVYFKRPWLAPDEACNPKEARGPRDDAHGDNDTGEYDPKGEVVLWVSPNIDGTTTPERKQALVAEAKTLFGLLFKK